MISTFLLLGSHSKTQHLIIWISYFEWSIEFWS